MARAKWNGVVIAESNTTEIVEGNHYFPPESVNFELLEHSPTTSHCGWKGTARYYTIVVDGHKNVDAAWSYPDPKSKAENIRDHLAFWKGITVEDTPGQQVGEKGGEGACEL